MIREFVINKFPLSEIKMGIARVLYAMASVVYGKTPRIIMRNGLTYEVDISEGIDLSLFLFGSFQRHVTNNKLIHLPEDSVIIDVGANFGALSIKFARAVPKGKVFSFEPTDYALTKFRRNMELNPGLASRIEVFHSFVSDKTIERSGITAYSSWKVNGEKADSKHLTHGGTIKPTENVASISLDDFCTNKQLSKVDLIKIDTDGHEYEVLMGAKEILKKYRPKLIFEAGIYIMTEKGMDPLFYNTFFEEFNYRLYDSRSGAVITPQNYRNYIPAKSTIDIIAKPIE